jgi:hypothetical protein
MQHVFSADAQVSNASHLNEAYLNAFRADVLVRGLARRSRKRTSRTTRERTTPV